MVRERSQLPIADSHDEILAAIRQNQVVLIRGETGSGKTTQVSLNTMYTGKTTLILCTAVVGTTQVSALAGPPSSILIP